MNITAIITTIRNVAVAVAAGAEIVEASAAVPTNVDTAAILVALAAHVISQSVDTYLNETKEDDSNIVRGYN